MVRVQEEQGMEASWKGTVTAMLLTDGEAIKLAQGLGLHFIDWAVDAQIRAQLVGSHYQGRSGATSAKTPSANTVVRGNTT